MIFNHINLKLHAEQNKKLQFPLKNYGYHGVVNKPFINNPLIARIANEDVYNQYRNKTSY